MPAPQGRSRYFLPLIYLICGVTWVVGTDYALGEVTQLPLGLQFIASAKGVAFVLASTLMLLLVQAWPRGAPLPGQPRARVGGFLRPIAIFLITAVGVVLAGYVLYQHQSREVAKTAAESLAGTVELTANQVEFWLEDRRDGIDSAGRSPLLAHALTAVRKPGPAAQERTCGAASRCCATAKTSSVCRSIHLRVNRSRAPGDPSRSRSRCDSGSVAHR